jgi:hypothetical protein
MGDRRLNKLEIDIVLNAKRAPERELSPSRFADTIEGIICDAVQMRLPGFEVEVRSLKANWPGASENFPEFNISK